MDTVDKRCQHCGRLESNAKEIGSTTCNPPFPVRKHEFNGMHPADLINPQIFFELVLRELQNARKKFPHQDLWKTLAALTEEVGELNQACLQFHDEPKKGKDIWDIRQEARQVIVMALRVVCDVEWNR